MRLLLQLGKQLLLMALYSRALLRIAAALPQVVNLHYLLSKAAVRARPSVLWCYKKELGFSTCVCARIPAMRALRG